jgi:TniQ
MPASAQARWPDPRLQRLPIRLPPFPNETVRSYVRRLEAANHLPFGTLDNHLRDPVKQSGPPRPQRLAAISGWPLGRLQYALPELSDARPISLAGTRHGALRGFDPIPRRACRRCLASRGITGEATCWVLLNANVCVRHQRWIGPTNRDDADQFDLASLLDVVAAARRYRRFASRLGDRRVESTYHVALHITLRWAEREDFGQHRNRRLRVLGFDPDGFLLASHPAVRAATYPDTVTMSGLLASPHWLRVAASLDHADHQRFWVEAARRLNLPDYRPYTGWDPLARWIDRNAPQQFREDLLAVRANAEALIVGQSE